MEGIATTHSNPDTSVFGRFTLGAIAKLDPETLLTEGEVAEVLRVSKRTVQRWRYLGQEPKPEKMGPRRVVYSVGTILKFAKIAA
jgi:predicted DNA-binding transcriptional regulator AlpA